LPTRSSSRWPRIDSGTVVAAGLLVTLAVLICSGRAVGWDATWRSFGVTPLQPPFFDMHVVLDYAACAAKGLDAYLPHSCNEDNFNIPPIWLWVGFLGLNGSDSVWLSGAMIVAALAVMVGLFRNRSAADGALALFAILSPSVLMGIERGNLDVLILALVGGAALLYREENLGRVRAAFAILAAAIVVKLFPMFCVALGARFNRRALLFAGAIAVFSLAYLAAIFPYSSSFAGTCRPRSSCPTATRRYFSGSITCAPKPGLARSVWQTPGCRSPRPQSRSLPRRPPRS